MRTIFESMQIIRFELRETKNKWLLVLESINSVLQFKYCKHNVFYIFHELLLTESLTILISLINY